MDFSNTLKLFGPVFLKTKRFLGVTLYYMLYVYYSKGITGLWNECFFFRFFFFLTNGFSGLWRNANQEERWIGIQITIYIQDSL